MDIRHAYSNPVDWSTDLFRWIRQHLQIRHCPGKREDAEKARGACAVTTHTLINIVGKEFQFGAPLCTCLQIPSLPVSEKTQLSCTSAGDAPTTEHIGDVEWWILLNLWSVGCDFLPFAWFGPIVVRPSQYGSRERRGPIPRGKPGFASVAG